MWGDNAGVRVHAIEWRPEATSDALPIVFVPGGTGMAWAAESLSEEGAQRAFGPRPILGVSRRGMGLSDTPASGYGPRDFAADVRAATRAAGYRDFVLFGHSMGVPISLELALTDASGIAALVLGDTPAQYIDFRASGTFEGAIARQPSFASWDEAFEGAAIRTDDPVADRARFDRVRHRYLLERDGRITTSWKREAIERTVEESVAAATDYWAGLGSLSMPVLLLDATEAWTPMTDADVERYRRDVKSLTVVSLPTGHDLGMSFPVRTDALFEALRRFLSSAI